jgi:hypothetical protein
MSKTELIQQLNLLNLTERLAVIESVLMTLRREITTSGLMSSFGNYSACHAQRLKSRATQPKPACAGWVRWVPVGVGRLWLCSRDFSRQAE